MRESGRIPVNILRKFPRGLSLLLLAALLVVCLLITFAQRRRTVTTGQSGAKTVTVNAGDDLQKAINAARPGDTITLEAGASFVGPITLPNKDASTDWITIRTSTPDSALPSSTTRISPADSALLPKILSPGSGQPALLTANGAHQ